MPSRMVILFIFAFWAASAGWMFYREYWPRLGPNDAPPLYFDLSDEIGRQIRWRVYKDKEQIGTLFTKTLRQPDLTYRFSQRFSFFENTGEGVRAKKVTVFDLFTIQTLYSAVDITPEGDLRRIEADVKLHSPLLGGADVVMEGKVNDDRFHCKFRSLAIQILNINKLNYEVKPIDMPPGEKMITTLYPLHKIPGLKAGRRWRFRQLQPMVMVFKAVAENSGLPIPNLGQITKPKDWLAIVSADKLKWKNEVVDCWRIDYTEVGKEEIAAKMWVGRSDELVLQQEGSIQGMSLVLQRSKK